MSDLVEMVLIPAGEFMMGPLPEDTAAVNSQGEPHKVEITKNFYIGKYLVTQKVWKAVMGNNPSTFKDGARPVEGISWFDCIEFCNRLSEMEGKELVYTINGTDVSCNWEAKGYRLLTEAEWEYAARGGEYHLYAGSNDMDEVAWHDDNSGGQTHPVGQKKSNGFGLYDMSGNTWEWVWDWFGEYSTDDHSDPTGPSTGANRVYRGGCWYNGASNMRISFRYGYDPSYRYISLGFRIGCTL